MRNILFFLLISAGLSSCSEDFLSQTLEIDPPEYDKQLVVHGFGNNLDSFFRVSVTRNFGILENVPDTAWAIRNATVEVLEDGQVKASLAMAPAPQRPEVYEALVLPGFFQPGKSYQLRVSHPDFETVTSSQVMPQPVQVDSVRFRQKAGIDTDGSKLSAVDVFLKDAPGVDNYYEVRVLIRYPQLEFSYDSLGQVVIDTIGYQEYPIDLVGSDDPNAVLTFGDGLAITDRFFDGQSYRFVARMYETGGYTLRVYVRTVTREYYSWALSAEQKYNSEDFPFAEPITTYSNLENGIGAFGLWQEQLFEVK